MVENTGIRFYLNCFFLFFASKLIGQEIPVPYLLKNGGYTYVKFGTQNKVLEDEFDFIIPFDHNHLSITFKISRGQDIRSVQVASCLKNLNLKNIFQNSNQITDSYAFLSSLSHYSNTINNEFYFYKKNESYGLIDTSGNIIVKPELNLVLLKIVHFNRIVAMSKQNQLFGMYDFKHNLLVPHSVKEFGESFSNNLIRFNVGEYNKPKWGYLDTAGNISIFPKFSYADNFNMGVSRVEVRGSNDYPTMNYINYKENIINLESIIKKQIITEPVKLVFKNKFLLVWHSKNDGVLTNQNSLSIFDKSFKKIQTIQLSSKEAYTTDWEVFDLIGDVLFVYLPHWKHIEVFDFKLNKKLYSGEFKGIGDNLFTYKTSKGWGYKDLNGATVIEPQFIDITPFKSGIALVKDIKGWHVINKKGNVLHTLGYKYDDSNAYGEGKLTILNERFLKFTFQNKYINGINKYFLIDTNGFEYVQK